MGAGKVSGSKSQLIDCGDGQQKAPLWGWAAHKLPNPHVCQLPMPPLLPSPPPHLAAQGGALQASAQQEGEECGGVVQPHLLVVQR